MPIVDLFGAMPHGRESVVDGDSVGATCRSVTRPREMTTGIRRVSQSRRPGELFKDVRSAEVRKNESEQNNNEADGVSW